MARLALTLIAPSGHSWQLLDALRSLMGPTRQAHGCLSCTVSVAAESHEPERITYVEIWSTDEDLRAHVRSDRFPRLLSLMEESLDAPSIEFQVAERRCGLEYATEVREEFGSEMFHQGRKS